MLTRWDPFAEMSRLMAGPGFGFGFGRDILRPAVDILEEKDAIVLRAELPGVKAEDVNVTVENGMLTISGERRFERDEKQGEWHRVESSYGSFSRSFALPDSVDASNVDATLDAGVLTVRLAKRAEAQPRRIQVKGGSSEAKRLEPNGRDQAEQPRASLS